MSDTTIKKWIPLGVIALVLACSEDPEPMGAGPQAPPFFGIVFGIVSTAGGDPVPAAVVEMTALSENCDPGAQHGFDRDVTDELGSYRTDFVTADGPDPLCIIVSVAPPQGSGLLARLTQGSFFSDRQNGIENADSVRVDVVLEPAQ